MVIIGNPGTLRNSIGKYLGFYVNLRSPGGGSTFDPDCGVWADRDSGGLDIKGRMQHPHF